jgi:hypothetical protein
MGKFKPEYQATVTRKAVFQTGRPNEPKIEMAFRPGTCILDFKLDGKAVDLDGSYCMKGSYATENLNAAFFSSQDDRYIYFPGSKISFHIRRKNSVTMGCYMNVKVCIPDDVLATEMLVGLFGGNPDGTTGNDFVDRQGKDLNHQGKTIWADAYNYCTDNWCVRNQADSLFSTPMPSGTCDDPYDDSLEKALESNDDLKVICGNNMACLVEGAAGDATDSIDSARELQEAYGVEIIPIQKIAEDPLEKDAIFEKTPVEPAPVLVVPTTGGETVIADPTPVDKSVIADPDPVPPTIIDDPAPKKNDGSAYGDPVSSKV